MSLEYKVVAINELIAEHLKGVTLFNYSGHFDKSVTDELVEQLDQLLSTTDLPTRTRKKTFNISIEVLQNLYHYLEEKVGSRHYSHGAFFVNAVEESIQIVSANYIANTEVNSLKSRIDIVNTLPEDTISNFYRDVLEIGGVSSKGGAGLGLIDIRKKSGHNLDYLFTEASDEYSIYILKITI